MKQSQFDKIMFTLAVGAMGLFFYSQYKKMKLASLPNASSNNVMGVRG